MRKFLVLAVAAMVATSVSAGKKKTTPKADTNKPVFTVVKQNPITSIKNQSRSGTCWAYSTLSFFESEILKKTGKEVDLCESFVTNKTYMDRAIQVVRFHGDCQFAQGGSAEDPFYCLENYGICPENAMPFPGSLYGDSLNNYNEFFSVLSPIVDAVAKSKQNKISNQWKVGIQGVLDAYLGKCPEKFMYEGKEYTPRSFADSFGLNWGDYVTITSYTHHPFYKTFAVEVQDNWRFPQSWNLPMNEMMEIIDNAIMNGYTIGWGGDVSEPGFTREGLAYMVDGKAAAQSLQGSDMARWLGMSAAKKKDIIAELGAKVPEVTPTQEMRQERFDNWELTDDHGMHIFGIAKDQFGKEYYMVKNSWGETGAYKGIWYMTKNFIAANTMDYIVNKNAIPAHIRKKMGI
ncbi:C1 family peptidase [Prevotella ihumii]|uniref:aminopeptidase C n=1 Tax=Prevotella ihumii TaxID=1917878 RepID=UPI00098091BB|nr:C1 family peptidase [Prevotella ihumii]